MTQQERNYLKECKEKQFIESIKGQKINGKVKGKFRLIHGKSLENYLINKLTPLH